MKPKMILAGVLAVISAAAAIPIMAFAEIENSEDYIPVSSVTLSPDKLELTIGSNDSGVLVYEISPKNATKKDGVTWSVTPKNIVTVTNGFVTAADAGEAVITIECDGKKADCKVKVTAPAVTTAPATAPAATAAPEATTAVTAAPAVTTAVTTAATTAATTAVTTATAATAPAETASSVPAFTFALDPVTEFVPVITSESQPEFSAVPEPAVSVPAYESVTEPAEYAPVYEPPEPYEPVYKTAPAPAANAAKTAAESETTPALTNSPDSENTPASENPETVYIADISAKLTGVLIADGVTVEITARAAGSEVLGNVVLPPNFILFTSETSGAVENAKPIEISSDALKLAGFGDITKLRLYYIPDKGDVSQVYNGVTITSDGDVIITLSHFSSYVIAETAPHTVSIAPASDASIPIAFVIIAALCAAAAIVFAVITAKKRKMNNE